MLIGLLRIGLPLLGIAALSVWFLYSHHEGKGTLRVTTSIPGAEIYIGGLQTGYSSDTTFQVPAKRTIVTVRKDGFVSEPEFVILNIEPRQLKRAVFLMHAQTAVRDTFAPLRPLRPQTFSTGEPVRSVPPAGGRHERRLLDFTSGDAPAPSRVQAPAATQPVAPSVTSPSIPLVVSDQTPLATANPLSSPLISTQVTVSSTPDGAEIFVNGQTSSHVTPYTFRGLDRGIYAFRVRREGMISRPDSVNVSLANDFQRELTAFELIPDPSLPRPTLTVSTVPLAAGFRVDGKPAGVGKSTLDLGYGPHRIEFSEVAGYKTPDPISISLTADKPQTEAVGQYERLVGNAFIAVVPSEEIEKFDGSQLRIYVDNELILDNPKQRFDATLLGRIVSGKRLVRVQYGDLSADTYVNAMDSEVIEITFRVESFFSKRSLKLREKGQTPLDQWQERSRKLTVLSLT
jgi:hypothetical protein